MLARGSSCRISKNASNFDEVARAQFGHGEGRVKSCQIFELDTMHRH